jgi:hypothetical protein
MSCGRTHQLEAVVLGQTSHVAAAELRAHAQKCALCRHELNWLETESMLFRQRAGRDEVAHLWAGVEARRQPTEARPWTRVLFAMAAAVALIFTLGTLTPRQVRYTSEGPETLESEMLMTPVLFREADEVCSKLPSGVGFQCAPPVPASFIASR